MNVLVVLPSYNERDNIVALLKALLERANTSVCVVDDSSPDGTADCVREAWAEHPSWRERVHLIVRSHKDGRGGAVRAGLEWGLAQRPEFDAFVEMDCDFSHEPRALETGLALLRAGAGVVIGARYPDGVIIGWPLQRRVFSRLANGLSRALIDRRVMDYTNGFRFYAPDTVRLILSRAQQHRGYIYLSETLAMLLRDDVQVAAFPIVFRNRERGVSNTSWREIRSALGGIVQIAWTHHTDRSRRLRNNA